jgi:cephalosporin hydroxylase
MVSQTLSVTYADNELSTFPLYTAEAFQAISRLWIKTGWAAKYSYNFSWMGRPVIQLPEDLLIVQELIHKVQPHVIIETGIAHGGSSVFYASVFEILGRGRVISIDIEIRPHNRKAIEAHPLKKRITLIERSSIAPETLEEVRNLISPNEEVMVVLDSNHTRELYRGRRRHHGGPRRCAGWEGRMDAR